MTSQVVALKVIASIPIDCDFWSEDDGWKGLCNLTYAQILSWSETTKGKDHLETLEILS
jgi:hypothetical protein